MKPEQKKSINRTILKCRHILEEDIEKILITFGIVKDEQWIEKDKLDLTDEQEQIYHNLREVLQKELKGGLSKEEALISYIREVVYTYLNRLVALRVMEVRGLVDEVLVKRSEYSGRSYGHRNFFEIAREFCKYQTDDGLAYFINIIFNEVTTDVGILFNTDDEYSIISPSNKALNKVIELLTTQIDEISWEQDEIIGWMYQYFNEEEKDDVFDRLYNKKEKIKSLDIPAATQLFTPDWIVEWIINNSLGKLRDDLLSRKRKYKRLEEIKLIDPACGSGHFLVKSYDLFYQYYLEDGYKEEEIPYLILKHNIYGIDIDPRAIQLTGLILFIKARTSLKKLGVSKLNTNISVNLVCADAVLLNGKRLEKLRETFETNQVLLEVIDIIYDEFKDTRIKGSLIQPEKRIMPLFDKIKAEKKKQFEKSKDKDEISLFSKKILDEFESEQEIEYLSKIEKELLKYLSQIYSNAIKVNDINNQLFANEAKKSVDLLNIFLQKYDVVITNPPYMGKGNMNEILKTFVNESYPDINNDLYSIFINRAFDFLEEDGIVGMITQESFMFIKSYEKLREFLLNNCFIYQFAHLGKRAFDDIGGERVSTAMFVLEKKKLNKSNGISKFIKLDHYSNATEKKKNLFNEKNLFNVDQNFFNQLENKPFLYDIPDEIKEIISNNKSFNQKLGTVKTGINTGNNDYFVRFWWEIEKGKLTDSNRNFVPYAKGGGSQKYYGALNSVVDWRPEEMKKYKGVALRNRSYFYKEGLTFSGVGSKGFGVRYLSEGFIFDSGGSFIDIKQGVSKFYVLGILASDFAEYLLHLYNPTINFKNNDIHRLPAIINQQLVENIESNVKEIIDTKKHLLSFQDKDQLFNIDNLTLSNGGTISALFKEKLLVEKNYLELASKNNILIYGLYNISEKTRELITNVIKANKKVSEIIEDEIIDIDKWYDQKGKNTDKSELINYILEKDILPNTIIKDFFVSLVSVIYGILFGRWKLNGFVPIEEEIVQLDGNFVEETVYDILELMFGKDNFEDIIEDEIPGIIGKDFLDWLQHDFFKEHIKKEQYQNRPIYWHICSPNKNFNMIIYYPKLTNDTMYKLKTKFVIPKAESYKKDYAFFKEKVTSSVDKKEAREYEKKLSEIEKIIDDLELFEEQLNEIIRKGYHPDINEGVLYNLKPINSILFKKIEK